jgi:hypothetical protein
LSYKLINYEPKNDLDVRRMDRGKSDLLKDKLSPGSKFWVKTFGNIIP